MSRPNIAPCMNGGDKGTSYANNSLVQNALLLKTRPIMEDAIKGMMFNIKLLPTCIKIADLGRAAGPNTFLTISGVIDTINSIRCCQQQQQHQHENSPLEFQVFLNDLPGNDFNTVFNSGPAFCSRLSGQGKGDIMGPCFVSGVPASFYGRLFPKKSMHFLHSSNSLHWLSKIPERLENNKENIHMAKSSPPDGRSLADLTTQDCCYILDLLAESLSDLVAEGLIEESDVNSFKIPFYNPYDDDDTGNTKFVFNKYKNGQNVTNSIRTVTESMLATHFGEAVIDNLFAKFALRVAHHLCKEKAKHVYLVISMTRNK
ncbi:hypothetical protein DITRI_Ditri12bG0096000 [Diplodiscus trichospermus]